MDSTVSFNWRISKKNNELPLFCVTVYLHVPPSPTDVQLSFNFGPSDGDTRQWNILIAMIPCNSRVLGISLFCCVFFCSSNQKWMSYYTSYFLLIAAPPDCLQYFTTRTGSVRTFNWRDVDSVATRQLANQDYSICFRSGSSQVYCWNLLSHQLNMYSLINWTLNAETNVRDTLRCGDETVAV